MRWRCPNHPVASSGQGSSASFRPPTNQAHFRQVSRQNLVRVATKHSFRTVCRRCRRDRRLHAAAIMAAALRPLLRRHAVLPPSSMLRSLFPAPYSKAAARPPAVCHAPLPPPLLKEVTPRRAPPIPKGEPRCCTAVQSTMSDSTKSLLDRLKDLKDSKKPLDNMEKNIKERREMIKKALHDSRVANAMFRVRLDGLRKLLAKIRDGREDSARINAIYRRLEDDYDKDWAIHESKGRLIDEQMKMLRKDGDDYINALREYHELQMSILKHAEEVEEAEKVEVESMEKVEEVENMEKVKKVAKVCAAAGLMGGLLVILGKI
ncbi:hypothetical protein ACQJBY_009587 [Aegilops geniculata]